MLEYNLSVFTSLKLTLLLKIILKVSQINDLLTHVKLCVLDLALDDIALGLEGAGLLYQILELGDNLAVL